MNALTSKPVRVAAVGAVVVLMLLLFYNRPVGAPVVVADVELPRAW